MSTLNESAALNEAGATASEETVVMLSPADAEDLLAARGMVTMAKSLT